ncbi:MAG: diguanylate cyclase [Candidatus Melainabacteria bacterium]|nr:diguanylate cyclase [Candidatus Melainabacteria bacterium]
MTYQATLSLAEEAEASLFQKIVGGIFGFFNCLAVRLVVIFTLVTLVMAVVADVLYPKLMTGFANKLVVQLADQAKKKALSGGEILQVVNKYNLAWYYLTTSDAKIIPSTKAYAPDLQKYGISAREVDWKGSHYYEAVESIGNGQILHIGVYAGQIVLPNLNAGMIAMCVPVPIGYLVVVLIGMLVLIIAALHACVSRPLSHLARACYSLLLTREAYSHITGGGLKVSGAVTEVQSISKGLRDIRRQYDEAVAARISKEEQLKRERSEHVEEKTIIAKQYEEQLAQSEQKLTELHTKEAEEEFINSLGRELDTLKSSKQVYHRVLEKLNDKFPTSIIFGAFFRVAKTVEPSLEAYLGFDERSVQAIKKIDHSSIARDILNTGQYFMIGPQALRDYGYQQLAQANSIRNIVYMPVKFQNRNLGLLAFYFVQEGQTVQERLRVLRNVVDLTARALYQVVLYEEETEAARTDPMTGLRNKKFFYEIMPQIFERAAAKPNENPISFIMIDGDHFKSVNDTYGHQVGDRMLQDLAKVIRQCVRTQDSLERSTGPGDYLIRYGGEEFVVVMEAADAQKAVAVAERIRQAVESKADWPGGIARWTVSLGVATYPVDAKKPDDLMSKADTALYYVKEELGRNHVCHAQQVPKAFKAKKTAAAITGELGVFDAAGLLQSIASSQKTGVLTVTAGADGKQLWMLFENGKPMQARMGKMAGNAAIVEFIVTFEEGAFNFQERVQAGRETKLPKLEDTYNVTKSLDRCIMDGALAQDNFNASKTILPSAEVYIRPIAQADFNARWTALSQLKEDDRPSPEEFQNMAEIIKRSDGSVTVGVIFKQLEPIAVYHLWRAAALLVQHGLVQTKAK